MARLTILENGSASGVFCDIEDKVVAGRLQRCDLVLEESQASRDHFEVERIGSCYQLRDLKSRNGTLLNDAGFEDGRLLSNGDVIRVGETRARFELAIPSEVLERRFGRFELLGEPKASSFGVLCRARQEGLQREVTLEILSPDYARDPDVNGRFLAMARAASLFQHNEILAVYDLGVVGELPYMSVARFNGQTLRRAVRQAAFSPSQSVAILQNLIQAIGHVHLAEKVHGRVSPSTVLVDAGGAVKLVGFGTDPRGRCTDPALPEAVWHAGFCAPEIGRGKSATPASDYYSIGAVAYWLLTGRPPYEGDDAAAVLRSHAGSDPVPGADLVAQGIPQELARAVSEFLSKSAGRRPDNAGGASGMLTRALAQSRPPAPAVSEPDEESSASSPSRRRGGSGRRARSGDRRSAGPSSSSRARKAARNAAREPIEEEVVGGVSLKGALVSLFSLALIYALAFLAVTLVLGMLERAG